MAFLVETGKAIVPKKFRPHLREYFRKLGMNEAPFDIFAVLFFIAIATTSVLFMAFAYPTIISQFDNPITQLILIFFFYALLNFALVLIVGLIAFFIFDIIIFNRTQKMETVLPEYLELVSTNLRGGMSLEQSLWAAINPEFTVLSDEISLTAKKVMTGTDLDLALNDFAHKYDSSILKRTISLIISEIGSGGKIADLLDRMINDMKETKKIRMEMTTSVISYMIFIGAVVIVIGPGLFALSYNIMNLISAFSSKLALAAGSGSMSGLPINFNIVEPDTQGFKNFSITAIIIISTCSSMIIAILEKGYIRAGIKYLPVFVLGSLGSYFIFFNILQLIFQALF